MEKFIEYGKWAVSIIGTFLTFLFGDFNIALQVLVVFMIIELISGIAKACVLGKLNSNVSFKSTVVKKGCMLLVLIVAVMLDRLLNTNNWMFRTLISFYLISTEGISILENIGALGVPIPQKLLNALEQLKEKDNE